MTVNYTGVCIALKNSTKVAALTHMSLWVFFFFLPMITDALLSLAKLLALFFFFFLEKFIFKSVSELIFIAFIRATICFRPKQELVYVFNWTRYTCSFFHSISPSNMAALMTYLRRRSKKKKKNTGKPARAEFLVARERSTPQYTQLC